MANAKSDNNIGMEPRGIAPIRCEWPGTDEQMIRYHDTEWGVPTRDDAKLFEYLVLDTFQAGLSWRTILHKRANFKAAFADFDPVKIANFTQRDIERLKNDAGIIRNRQKISATINNAEQFLKTQHEFGSFANYIWQFVEGKTFQNKWADPNDVPATSPESDTMSRDMKARGYRFVGSTICYAFMQGAGLVNDHTTDCFRHPKLLSD